MAKRISAFLLSGRVEVDAKSAKKDLRDVESQAKSTAHSLKETKSSLGSLVSGALSVAGGNLLTNLLSGVTGAMKDTVAAGFDYNRLQEQTKIGFEVMLKSGEKAKDFMQELQAFAESSPMDLPGVYENAQRLKAMGFEAKQVIPILTAAGDAAAGLGKVGGEAAAKVEQITTALGQMWSKGKVSAEEMNRQLVEAGVPAWKYLADEIAKTDKAFAKLTDDERSTKVQQMAEKGMLNARAAVAVITRGMEKDNEGLGERISKETLGGIESNRDDKFKRRAGEATQAAFEAYKQLQQKLLEGLNSDGAGVVASGINLGSKAVISGAEAALRALTSGRFIQAGLDAIDGYTKGIGQGTPAAEVAGVNLVNQTSKAVAEAQQSHSPSLLFAKLGRFAALGYVQGFQETLKPDKLLEELKKLMEDPRIKAFLAAISRAEGGASNRIVGGGTFRDFSRHPNRVGIVTDKGPSTAAGSWQITGTTWRNEQQRLGLPDFSFESQRIAALDILRQTGAIEKLLAGDIESAAKLAGSQWQALPSSSLGGKYHVSMDEFLRFIDEAQDEDGFRRHPERNKPSRRVTNPIGGARPKPGSLGRGRQTASEDIYDERGRLISSGDTGGLSYDYPVQTGYTATAESRIHKAPDWMGATPVGSMPMITQEITPSNPLPVQIVGNDSYDQPSPPEPSKPIWEYDLSGLSMEQWKSALDPMLEKFKTLNSDFIETENNIDRLATEIVPRGVKALELPKLLPPKKALNDAFGDLPPLVKSITAVDRATQQLKEMGKGMFEQFAQGIGSMVENFVLLGDESDASMQKMVASVLAGVASQATVLAIMETAYGIAALTPWGFALYGNPGQHFAAAAMFATVAVGAAIGGRAIAGDSFKDKSKDGAQSQEDSNRQYSDANFAGNNFTRREFGGGFSAGETLLVGERRPEVVRFDQSGHVFSSVGEYEQHERRQLQAARLRRGAGNSNTPYAHLVRRMADALDRLDAVSPGDVVAQGARRNPRAFSDGLNRALDGDPNVARGVGRRLGR